MTPAQHQAHTCDYCGWQHPVAVMVSDHEQECEARPRVGAA